MDFFSWSHSHDNVCLLFPLFENVSSFTNLSENGSWSTQKSKRAPKMHRINHAPWNNFPWNWKWAKVEHYHQGGWNFPPDIHTPPPIWIMERERYKVTTKLLATLIFWFLVGGKKRKGGRCMHWRKCGINDFASLAYSVKDCKGTEIKSAKVKKKKKKEIGIGKPFLFY